MKKVLSVLVVLSMLLSMLPATVSVAHWADADVAYLVENGAIAEDDAMLENLDTPITRSQMVKVIVALLDGDEPIEGKEYFTDISSDDTHIAKAAENGFVNGFGDGTFRPNNPITRQDFFTIVGRAYGLDGEATQEFADNHAIADYAKPHIDALQCIGIVNGYGDGTVNPRGNITVAETLAVMHRTDAHVKANTPKEEEKPKPKLSGGSGGGGGGGGGGGSNSTPTAPTATFDIELTDDYSSGIVAYVAASINNPSDTPLKEKIVIREAIYMSDPYNPSENWELAKETGQYIAEEDGRFAIPDFGSYELYLIDENNNATKQVFTVKAPDSNDMMPPQLDVEVVSDIDSTVTFKVSASDDIGIARVDYVQETGPTSSGAYNFPVRRYGINVNGRNRITEDTVSINVPDKAGYDFCAMDVNGNCTYVAVYIYRSGANKGIHVHDDGYHTYGGDHILPWVGYELSTTEEVDGALDITVNIGAEWNTISEKGYFYLDECYTVEDATSTKAFSRSNSDIDVSQGIPDLLQYEDDCGGYGSMHILKNFYEATKEGSEIEIKGIKNNTITVTKNGVYFIYARTRGDIFTGTPGDLTVRRVEVNNIKTASATFEVKLEDDATSEDVAHVTATVDPNPNAPVTQMFVVKSDYEPEAAGAYRAYTPNGKAQKIWDEVSISGEYIPVEESKFSVSEYGTYSLYMLDEYGNWGVSEVNIEEPAPEPDITEP